MLSVRQTDRCDSEEGFLTDVFLSTGCLMRVSDAEVRQQIVESVKSFYTCVAPKEPIDGTGRSAKPKPRTFHSNNRLYKPSLSEALSWLLWWRYFFKLLKYIEKVK